VSTNGKSTPRESFRVVLIVIVIAIVAITITITIVVIFRIFGLVIFVFNASVFVFGRQGRAGAVFAFIRHAKVLRSRDTSVTDARLAGVRFAHQSFKLGNR
jgi:hypothetical protein